MFESAVVDFATLGVKSLEFTGGGEPTLWPHIDRAMELCKKLGLKMGLITNGLALDNIEDPSKLDWVRVSLNTLDYKSGIELGGLPEKTKVTFCYIWNDNAPGNFDKVVEFANYHKIVCRVAPDCIQPLDRIELEIAHIRKVLSGYESNNYVFLSDFNIDLHRNNNDCRIHMIKPCLYLDGWVYACPSAELAIENDKQIQHKTRICTVDNIIDFYTKDGLKKFEFDCSYCKYVKQQEILEAILTETECNEFC
jgi:MoaA/NifB/PqqE/SkfB family radical SAM enzyme